jgi:hypothetical protein
MQCVRTYFQPITRSVDVCHSFSTAVLHHQYIKILIKTSKDHIFALSFIGSIPPPLDNMERALTKKKDQKKGL